MEKCAGPCNGRDTPRWRCPDCRRVYCVQCGMAGGLAMGKLDGNILTPWCPHCGRYASRGLAALSGTGPRAPAAPSGVPGTEPSAPAAPGGVPGTGCLLGLVCCALSLLGIPILSEGGRAMLR